MKKLFKDPIFIWCFIFIAINVIFRATGGTNPASRLATMRAMAEQQTFKIDTYKDWTIDWSQTPDGSYYSNKAPGPMFVGFPFFWLIEQVTKYDRKEVFTKEGYRTKVMSPSPRILLSLTTQLIPFAVLCFVFINIIFKKSQSIASLNFAALSLLFGSTTSMLMNVYFGHGMAAIFLMGIALGFIKKEPFIIAISFGFAMLTEYPIALSLPFLIIALALTYKKDLSWIKPFILGGVLPGIIWCWYHFETTGSIFETTTQYPNPAFVTAAHIDGNIGGLFYPYPQLEILKELFFGSSRGLLVTQPWLIIAIFLPLLFRKKLSSFPGGAPLLLYIYSVFLILLSINAMFEEWHSGAMAGPRYMCAIFPLFAFFISYYLDELPKKLKIVLWASLAVSVVFRGLIYATTILAPQSNLWTHSIDSMGTGSYKRVFIYSLLITVALILSKQLRTKRA